MNDNDKVGLLAALSDANPANRYEKFHLTREVYEVLIMRLTNLSRLYRESGLWHEAGMVFNIKLHVEAWLRDAERGYDVTIHVSPKEE